MPRTPPIATFVFIVVSIKREPTGITPRQRESRGIMYFNIWMASSSTLPLPKFPSSLLSSSLPLHRIITSIIQIWLEESLWDLPRVNGRSVSFLLFFQSLISASCSSLISPRHHFPTPQSPQLRSSLQVLTTFWLKSGQHYVQQQLSLLTEGTLHLPRAVFWTNGLHMLYLCAISPRSTTCVH